MRFDVAEALGHALRTSDKEWKLPFLPLTIGLNRLEGKRHHWRSWDIRFIWLLEDSKRRRNSPERGAPMQLNDEQIHELATGFTEALREPLKRTYNDRYILPFLPSSLVRRGRRDTSTRSAGGRGRSASRGYTAIETHDREGVGRSLLWEEGVALSYIVRQVALYALCKITGHGTQVDLVLDVIDQPLCPAICLVCDYSEAMEPKTRKGWCPVCEQHTMVSALVLAGVYPNDEWSVLRLPQGSFVHSPAPLYVCGS